MKKFITTALAIIICAMSIFSFASCAKDEPSLSDEYDAIIKEFKFDNEDCETLTVATSPDFAPMEFVDLSKKDQDKYVGFDIILANYIAKELNMKLVIKPMAFDACTAALQTGKADLAISGFSWTEERAEFFNISNYYKAGDNESEQTLIVKKGDEGKFKDKTSYEGMVIGAQGGSLQKTLVEEQLVTKGATIKLYESLNDAAEALKTGKIDALAVAVGNGEAFVSSSNDTLAYTDFYFEVKELYKNNVILLNKNSDELLEKVNAALDKAMENGLYEKWYAACQKYSGIDTKDEAGFDENGNKIEG